MFWISPEVAIQYLGLLDVSREHKQDEMDIFSGQCFLQSLLISMCKWMGILSSLCTDVLFRNAINNPWKSTVMSLALIWHCRPFIISEFGRYWIYDPCLVVGPILSNFQVRMQPCQQGVCCILLWMGNHGGLLLMNEYAHLCLKRCKAF